MATFRRKGHKTKKLSVAQLREQGKKRAEILANALGLQYPACVAVQERRKLLEAQSTSDAFSGIFVVRYD